MKQDITKHPHWSKDEFVAFLLFFAAKANMEYVDEEREMILKIISVDQLRQIEKEFYGLSDFQSIEIIHSYKTKYYSTPAEKKEVLDRIKNLFTADGEYDTMEKNMLLMLKKIL